MNAKLRTYTNELIPVIGIAEVKVTYNDVSQKLPLWIIQGNGPTLFGRNWLEFIKLDWPVIKSMACDVNHNAILDKYPSLLEVVLAPLKVFKPKSMWMRVLSQSFVKRGLYLT